MNTHVVPVIVRTERLERSRNRARLELAALRLSRILGARYVRAEGLIPDVHLTEVLATDNGKHVVFRSHVEGREPLTRADCPTCDGRRWVPRRCRRCGHEYELAESRCPDCAGGAAA